MGKYIKKYETIGDWSIDPDAFRRPGVSWFVEENELFYQKWFENNVVVKFVITGSESVNVRLVAYSTRNIPCTAYYYGTVFVDGNSRTISEHGSVEGGAPYGSTITFTPGTHTVKYPLKNFSELPAQSFTDCTDMTEIILPENITSIGTAAFNGCTGLSSITCMAGTPPTLGSTGVFLRTNNCPIYVPDESLESYQTAWSNITGMASRLKGISEKSSGGRF